MADWPSSASESSEGRIIPRTPGRISSWTRSKASSVSRFDVAQSKAVGRHGIERLLDRGKDVTKTVEKVGPAVIRRRFQGHEVHAERHPPGGILLPIGEAPDDALANVRGLAAKLYPVHLVLAEMGIGLADRLLEYGDLVGVADGQDGREARLGDDAYQGRPGAGAPLASA